MASNSAFCPVCEGLQTGRLQRCSRCFAYFHFPSCGVIPAERVPVDKDGEDWRDNDSATGQPTKVVERIDQAVCGLCSGWSEATIFQRRVPSLSKSGRLTHEELLKRQSAKIASSDDQYLLIAARHAVEDARRKTIQLEKKLQEKEEQIAEVSAQRDSLRRNWLEVNHFKCGYRPNLSEPMISLVKEVAAQRLSHLQSLITWPGIVGDSFDWKQIYPDEILSLTDVRDRVLKVKTLVSGPMAGNHSDVPAEALEWTLTEIVAQGDDRNKRIEMLEQELRLIERSLSESKKLVEETQRRLHNLPRDN